MSAPESEEPREQGERGPTTILVIDDDAATRAMVRYLFDEPEYRVLEAPDGEAGLALVRAAHPDCVLLDLAMPGLDGFEVLARLQADPRTREVPVLILTATGERLETMERVLGGGAVDCITKPVAPAWVAVRVRAAIERRRLQREVHELRSSFTSMLVHDLKAPLTIITGYLQLMEIRADTLPSYHRRYLGSIRDACERMVRLIADILDLSKLEAGMVRLEPAPLDLAALAREMVERVRPVAAQHSVRLATVPEGGSADVVADAVRVEQVIMNLLGNALKFTPPGGEVTVSVAEREDGVEVAVSDTGPGIPPEEMRLLFEKFRQTSSTSFAKTQATGLGLVICRHLVEAHGGRIWAESQPGRGSRFVFSLPRG